MLAASRRMQPFVGGKTLTGEAPTISGTSSDLCGQLHDVVRQADCSAGAVLGRSGCAKATSEATTHLRCSTLLLVGSKLAALMPQCDECGGIVGGVLVLHAGRGSTYSAPSVPPCKFEVVSKCNRFEARKEQTISITCTRKHRRLSSVQFS
jgi:hypothetical protein